VPSAQIPVHSDQPVRLSSHFGVLVREDTAFTNSKGVEKKGTRKRAEQALDKLQEPLRKILEPEEAVLYIARGQVMPSGVERFFLGWHALYLAPAVLVLTNRRLLQFFVGTNGAWKRGTRSVRWGDMEEAKVKGLLGAKLNIKYRDGKKEVYWGMVRDDTNKIRLLLAALLPTAAGETSPAHSITSLCPECRAALTPGVYECPNCRLTFKDERTALRRSLLIPGGGFFYTGHPLLGIVHSLVELIVFFMLVFWILVALGIAKPDSSPGEAPTDAASAVVVVIFLVIILAVDKGVMAKVARKQVQNYIPAS
jgi:Bacterial PH domain